MKKNVKIFCVLFIFLIIPLRVFSFDIISEQKIHARHPIPDSYLNYDDHVRGTIAVGNNNFRWGLITPEYNPAEGGGRERFDGFIIPDFAVKIDGKKVYQGMTLGDIVFSPGLENYAFYGEEDADAGVGDNVYYNGSFHDRVKAPRSHGRSLFFSSDGRTLTVIDESLHRWDMGKRVPGVYENFTYLSGGGEAYVSGNVMYIDDREIPITAPDIWHTAFSPDGSHYAWLGSGPNDKAFEGTTFTYIDGVKQKPVFNTIGQGFSDTFIQVGNNGSYAFVGKDYHPDELYIVYNGMRFGPYDECDDIPSLNEEGSVLLYSAQKKVDDIRQQRTAIYKNGVEAFSFPISSLPRHVTADERGEHIAYSVSTYDHNTLLDSKYVPPDGVSYSYTFLGIDNQWSDIRFRKILDIQYLPWKGCFIAMVQKMDRDFYLIEFQTSADGPISFGLDRREVEEKALELNRSKKFQETLELTGTAIADGVVSEDIYFERAFALGGLGRYAEAITFYEKVLEINPGESSAKANIEWCRERM